jgi:hypothetical protein
MKPIKYIDRDEVLRIINSHKKEELESEDEMFNIALELVEREIKEMPVSEEQKLPLMNVNEDLIHLVIDNPGLPVIPVVTAVFVNGNGDFNLNIKPCSVKLGEYAEMDGKFYDDKDLFREDYYELKGKFLKGKYSDTKSLYILLDQIAKKFFKKAIFLYVNIFM